MRESEHTKAVLANLWSHHLSMRYNKAVYANSATNLGKNISEIFRHEETEKIKALNAHLGKRAIYTAQHIEGQEMQLVLAAVFQECLITSS